jgi:hypothetical protein
LVSISVDVLQDIQTRKQDYGAILELEKTNAGEEIVERNTRTYQPKAPTSIHPSKKQ